MDQDDFDTVISRILELHEDLIFRDFDNFIAIVGDIMDHAYIAIPDDEEDE